MSASTCRVSCAARLCQIGYTCAKQGAHATQCCVCETSVMMSGLTHSQVHTHWLHVKIQSVHSGCILKKRMLAAGHSWESYHSHHRSLRSVSEHVKRHAATDRTAQRRMSVR